MLKLTAVLALASFQIQFISGHCSPGQVMTFNKSNEVDCKVCPKNCQTCFLTLDDEINCSECESGYFMTNYKKVCKACYENCKECTGSGKEQCITPMKGFYYDKESKEIKKCEQDGCQSCEGTHKCVSCDEGFIAQKIDEKEKYVDCSICDIENCKFCVEKEDQVKNSNFKTCKLCQKGFGLINSKCEKCPENCEFC